jgi:hypothetical protein
LLVSHGTTWTCRIAGVIVALVPAVVGLAAEQIVHGSGRAVPVVHVSLWRADRVARIEVVKSHTSLGPGALISVAIVLGSTGALLVAPSRS